MELYITQYLADKILSALLNGVAFTLPTEVWAALFTTTAPGVYAEVAQPWYGRKRIFQDLATAPFWTAPANHPTDDARYSGNSAEIAYLEAEAGQDADVTSVALIDEADNILMAGLLSSVQEVREGRTFRFRLGDLKVSFDKSTGTFNLAA